jgi:hypothetical protein
MALWNRDKGPQSLGMLMAQPEKKARSQDIKEQSQAAVKKEYNSDKIVALFGKEGSLGKSGAEKNKGFFAGIKERMMAWSKKRQGEATAKFLDYGQNYLNKAPGKMEYQKDEDPAKKVEQAQTQASERVVSITSSTERNIDVLSQREQALMEALVNYNTAAKSAGRPEVALQQEKLAA